MAAPAAAGQPLTAPVPPAPPSSPPSGVPDDIAPTEFTPEQLDQLLKVLTAKTGGRDIEEIERDITVDAIVNPDVNQSPAPVPGTPPNQPQPAAAPGPDTPLEVPMDPNIPTPDQFSIDTTPPGTIIETDITPDPSPAADLADELFAGLVTFPNHEKPDQSEPVPAPMTEFPKPALDGDGDPAGSTHTLLGSVYFASNSTALEPSEQVVLIDLLPQIEKKKLLVVGYSDRTGDKALNAQLAYKRARSVKDFYVTTGAKAADVFAAAKGACCYKTDGKTEEDRRLNRRVEIYEKTESFAPPLSPSTQE